MGDCSFLDDDGNLRQEGFDLLTSIIEAYEAEQARRCEAMPRCRTDGGVRAAHIDRIELFSDDLNHLDVEGNAVAAELVWPVVADIFGLDSLSGRGGGAATPGRRTAVGSSRWEGRWWSTTRCRAGAGADARGARRTLVRRIVAT